MAKEIDKIIQSKTAPKSNNVLWDDGENLKINRNGKWESTSSNPSNITEELKDLGIEYDNVVINVTQLELFEWMNSEVIPNEHPIIPILEKATKALNVTLIYITDKRYFDIIPLAHKKHEGNNCHLVFNKIDLANRIIDSYSAYTFWCDGTQWYCKYDEI